jgi:2-dehydropantoate 2-reductase
MRIAVMGAGAVGGLLGGRLALFGEDVHLIARGSHLEAIRARGLRLHTPDGDETIQAPASADPAAVGACDAVLFCVKSYDTEEAAERCAPLLRAGTAVLSLQNGVDNEQRIAAVTGPGHVLGGVAFVFAEVSEPGVITQTGSPPRLVLGELDGTRSQRAVTLSGALNGAGVTTEVSDDIRVALWQKYVFICAVAGMTAATRAPIGAIRDSPAAWAMFRQIADEVAAVADAEGVRLPDGTVDEVVDRVSRLDPGARSSLTNDLAAGRPLALEALHGTVSRLAHDHGVDAPMCEAVYAILQPADQRARRA